MTPETKKGDEAMNDQDPQTMSNAAVAERMTSRISNSLVIAAGLVALGLYASGDEAAEAPTYQAVPMPDGRVVRLNTESGSVVSCDSNRCAIIFLQGDRLRRIDGREGGEEGDGDGDGDAPAQPAAPQQPTLPAPPASPPPGAAVQPPGPGPTPQSAPGPAQPNPGQPGR